MDIRLHLTGGLSLVRFCTLTITSNTFFCYAFDDLTFDVFDVLKQKSSMRSDIYNDGEDGGNTSLSSTLVSPAKLLFFWGKSKGKGKVFQKNV